MAFLTEENKKQLQEYFRDQKRDTTVVLFNTDDAPEGETTATLLREITALNDKLHLEEYDLIKDAKKAEEYGVERAPGYVLLDENKEFTRVAFSGVPLGHEINSFLSALREVGADTIEMPEALRERVEKIEKPVDIKVFVTLSCPHCPGAVQKAHALALKNKNIRAEMIEAASFPELSGKYGVSSVPHIVFNDSASILGNQPFDEFVRYAENA